MMDQSIGRYTIAELLTQHRDYLFNDFLPFMEQHVIDPEHGGFKCNTDRAGNNITKNKRTWYDGRGVWVYSYLYNNFVKDPQYLEIAHKTIDLLFSARTEALWPWGYSQSGKDLREHEPDIYGNLFVAEGLIEFSAAAEDRSYMQRAKDILFDCVALYDRPDYLYDFGYSSARATIRKPKVLGHWMILLNLSKQILKREDDAEVKLLADRCLDALLARHLNPEFELMVEFLEGDMTLCDGGLDQFVYTGHAIEVLWMVMEEGIRRKEDDLFKKAAMLFRRHLEVAWDDVYGGVFHCCEQVNENKWLTDKVLWAQQEVLIGLLIIIEHSGERWARYWFDKVYTYVKDTYRLEKYGYALWNIGGDRKMTFKEESERVENYHTPRHLMRSIQLLERIERR